MAAASVAAKRMPPWLASANCGGPFVDARVLTAEQISLFDAWAKAGAPEGNKADAPAKPSSSGQRLSRVDATLQIPAAYTPNETLRDDYRCFIVDPAVTKSTMVTAYDIATGSQKVVHHVILYAVDEAGVLVLRVRHGHEDWLDDPPGDHPNTSDT